MPHARARLLPWVLALSACSGPPNPEEATPFAAELRAFAAERTAPGARFANPAESRHFSPTGVSVDEGTVWVWSAAQPRQVGFQKRDGEWAATDERQGPLRTRRCVDRWCVGAREPGGVIAVSGEAWTSGLPTRGGFVDLARVGDFLYVLDGVEHQIVAMNLDGEVQGSVDVPAAPLRMQGAGDKLWVLSGTPPFLSVFPLQDGLPGLGVPKGQTVPARDAVYDPERQMIWTVGPLDIGVERQGGAIRGMGTMVFGWPLGDRESIRWHVEEIIDGSRIALDGGRLVVSATGSDAVAYLDPDQKTARLVAAGLAPQGLAWIAPGVVAVASHLDDTLRILGDDAVLSLDSTPRTEAADVGERLFYSPAVWSIPESGAYTCNSCHWDTGVDHRKHPGRDPGRWEQTRGLGGVAALHPLFTPGQGQTLAGAVEGLVRLLDVRFEQPTTTRWWLESRTITVKGDGEVTLSAQELREALVAFLATLPVERGPLYQEGLSDTAREGLALFLRDCASCHEPSPVMARREKQTDVVGYLATGPLVFAAPLWSKTGVEPYFTARGNRVSPLWELDRGGPFFSNGSASSIEALLHAARPGTRHVHDGGDGPTYSTPEVGALRDFLLSI